MKVLLTAAFITMVMSVMPPVEKTARLVDQSKVSYNVSENQVLNGAFEIKDVKDITRVRGGYTNDKRSGNWYCFDAAGKMVLRYNYDLKKIVSLDEDQLGGISAKVLDKDTDAVNNASMPVPVCSIDQMKKIVEEQLKNDIPAKMRAEGGQVTADFTIKVNPDGEAKYFAKYVFKDLSYTTMVYVKDKVFQIEWLPSSYKGKAYKSEVTFSSSFELVPGDHKRFIWNM
jgi:hypothetical protein